MPSHGTGESINEDVDSGFARCAEVKQENI